MATQTTDAGQAVAGAAKAGMPQLDFSTFSNQIFWLVITLVVIYFVLSRIALPRIGGALADRAGTIMNDLAEAEDLKSRALEAEQAYEKALADARAEAQNINVAMRAEIQGQLDEELAKADAEISARTEEAAAALAEIRNSAKANVKTVAKATAKEIVAAMGGKADAKTVTAAVTERMKG
ncbi:F0F1 ATP synthase subunit B' [Planktomarina temperata]|jgi:F-type H+-transporting ATPase subunit b|nr:F0F1 ATP synthase subunit B' [bacterium]MDB4227744.1 F0F1 ATP synthase subunit B' [bacterium]MDB9810394.1 F0F1 ATP synthase subunit B' [Planktomarina temperata]MDC1521161.1 F0F1 ATP synthase subunit B' [Planktomarina temperata]